MTESPTTPLSQLEKLILESPEATLRIFIDGSGSNKLWDANKSLMAIFGLAIKHNRGVVASQFSHFSGKVATLRKPGDTATAVELWNRFCSQVPKVFGGTDYTVVWGQIQETIHISNRINIMVTDFQWWPGERLAPDAHPKNVFYMSTSDIDNHASELSRNHFAAMMRSTGIAPDIDSRLLDDGAGKLRPADAAAAAADAGACADDAAATGAGALRQRAEAAEAKVAAVEALLPKLQGMSNSGNNPDSDQWDTGFANAATGILAELRAALATEPAEPAAGLSVPSTEQIQP